MSEDELAAVINSLSGEEQSALVRYMGQLFEIQTRQIKLQLEGKLTPEAQKDLEDEADRLKPK